MLVTQMGNEIKDRARDDRLLMFLLRHGKPQFPDARPYIYGRTDYPLCERGAMQAETMGRALACVGIERYYSSPLSRAVQTAEIVRSLQPGPQPEILLDDGLVEVCMGSWEGRPKEEVIKEGSYINIFATSGVDLSTARSPGGETFVEVQARGRAAIDRIAAACADVSKVLVVGHGGCFWTIISSLVGTPLGGMMRFGLDFCALHLVELRRSTGAYRLIRYNWSPDLTSYQDMPAED